MRPAVEFTVCSISEYSLICERLRGVICKVRHLAVPFGMGGQETLIGLQPQRDAFGIIQPVDANHQGARNTSDDLAHQFGLDRTPRQAGELSRFDSHRKGADAHDAVAGAQPARNMRGCAQLARQIAGEIGGIIVGLKAHQVVMAEQKESDFHDWASR